MTTAGNVVIVDAYQPTRRLAPEFQLAGFSCVRVQSTPAQPRVYRGGFPERDYIANIVHEGDIDQTAREVARYQPRAVLPGGELGVELADTLSEKMGTATNGTAQSAARRDKFLMADALGRAGLRAARQIRVTADEELRAWHESMGGRIVVKPARSSGGDGVHFCDNATESVHAFRKIRSAENIFSERNHSVIAQEYLRGTEYIVDAVSCDGRHQICDIWRTTRMSANGVLDLCDGVHLLPRNGSVQDQLAAYAVDVLDALGVRHGPSHLEIKMIETGPCLVEMGARLPGADLPHYARSAIGESQLDWVVDAYLRPGRFRRRCGQPYELKRHFAAVAMISPVSGTLRRYPSRPDVEALESLSEIRELVRPGQLLQQTSDDLTYPMIVNLSHRAEETVLRDAGTLRYLDGPSFYDLATDGPAVTRTACVF